MKLTNIILSEVDRFAGQDPKAGSTIKGKGFMAPRQKPKSENTNPEVHRLVNAFLRKVADTYDYSLQDAAYAVIRVLKSQNYDGLSNEDLNPFDGIDKVLRKAEPGRTKSKEDVGGEDNEPEIK